MPPILKLLCVIIGAASACAMTVTLAVSSAAQGAPAASIAEDLRGIAPHVPRHGRSRPVVAVIGENTFTELTDYVVPYGVLKTSGVADVFALSTQPGPIQMFPALRIQPQATIDEFDARFPEGADYVIVPAVHHTEDPTLRAWIIEQSDKGATIVGVCDGVWVVAHAGLLKGRRAVGHWYSFDDLEKKYRETTWVRNRRYIADTGVVTTTGVTASIPVALALIEAIGGKERAGTAAQALGVSDWSATHRSEDFKLRARHVLAAAANWLSFWAHDELEISIVDGADEVRLALIADAYSRTYRSKAFSTAPLAAPVSTRGGLLILPDRVVANPGASVHRSSWLDEPRPVASLNVALQEIAERYGLATSELVALQLEYSQSSRFAVVPGR